MEVKKGERRSRVVVAALLDFLAPVVGEDYLRGVVAGIARDVKRDLDETAEREFNDSDMRLAVGEFSALGWGGASWNETTISIMP